MTDKTPREELDEAIRILKEDGFHVRRHIQAELDARGIKLPEPAVDPAEPPKEPGEGDPPPAKDPPAVTEKKDWWFR